GNGARSSTVAARRSSPTHRAKSRSSRAGSTRKERLDMEISQPISSDDLDLTPVFGALDDEMKARVLEELRRAEATLAALRAELARSREATVDAWAPPES